jgi:putative FmdB family regulatory protein
MAQYEYICNLCSAKTTKERSIKDADPGYNCESCNKSLVRVYLSVGAVFNGTGFYSTDNRKQ